MKIASCIFYVVYAALFISVEAYKILVVNPLPVRSLNLLGEGFVRHLLDAGHEVTYVTNYPKKNSANERYHEVDVSSNLLNISADGFTIKTVMDNEIPMKDMKMLQDYALFNALNTLENKNLQKLLEDTNQSFDAVLVDYYETEVYAGLSALYDCPMIWATSMGPHWQALRLVDEPSNPSYTADYLSSNTVPFGFQERLEELWAQIKWTWIKWTSTLPQEKDAYEKVFKPLLTKRGKYLPDYYKVIYNASLMFSNYHNAFGGLPKVPQNLKLIGGYHIEHPPKPLPEDLQSLMDNAKHGVIYFSMGSTFSSKDLPKSVIDELLEVFGKLKQTVIWKFEEDLPNKPTNLVILKWAPQPSILAHPNCLFFITHGGLLSSTEAIHFGVPIIGIPIFLDQFVNINKAAARGYGIRVRLDYELPNSLRYAIRTMLTEPKYGQLAKELSAIYHHRPLHPGKEVVHWVEHVIKTKGATHLRSPALDIPFYKKLYLDLAAILIAVAILLSSSIKWLTSKLQPSSKRNKEKKN